MLELQNVHFSYPNGIKALSGINLSVQKFEHLALIGESGCGKSSLLKVIYGLYDLDMGSIYYDRVAVLGPKYNLIAGMENMKYLAQDFDLMPFTTVAENVGKQLSNVYKDRKAARVAQLLELVDMTNYAQTKVQHLSGGQQQRVALAQVLALAPKLLLLDEPFNQIDAFRRNGLRRKLFRYLKKNEIGCVFATHDFTDILAFADKVVVLKEGAVVQIGIPQTVYRKPLNLYTASLFGDVSAIPKQWIDPAAKEGEIVYVYPEQFAIVQQSALAAQVIQCYNMSSHFLIEGRLHDQPVFFNSEQSHVSGSICFLAVQFMDS